MVDKYIKVSRIEQVINELVIRSNNTRDDTKIDVYEQAVELLQDESLRAKYKAGSDGYKSLTKRITLYNRAIREAEK